MFESMRASRLVQGRNFQSPASLSSYYRPTVAAQKGREEPTHDEDAQKTRRRYRVEERAGGRAGRGVSLANVWRRTWAFWGGGCFDGERRRWWFGYWWVPVGAWPVHGVPRQSFVAGAVHRRPCRYRVLMHSGQRCRGVAPAGSDWLRMPHCRAASQRPLAPCLLFFFLFLRQPSPQPCRVWRSAQQKRHASDQSRPQPEFPGSCGISVFINQRTARRGTWRMMPRMPKRCPGFRISRVFTRRMQIPEIRHTRG